MANELQRRGKVKKEWLTKWEQSPTAPDDWKKKNPEIQALMKRYPGAQINIPKEDILAQMPEAKPTKEASLNPLQRRGRVKKASSAGSTLASHRWKRLAMQGPEDMPVAGGGSQTYEQLTAPKPTPLSDFESRKGPEGLMDFEAPSAGRMHATKQDIPNRLARAAVNLPESINQTMGVEGLYHMGHGLATAPGETVKGLVDYVGQALKAGGKAAAWAAAQSVNPNIEALLAQQGIEPDTFLDMVADDPAGTILSVLAPLEAGRHGRAAYKFAKDPLPGSRPPQPGDFPELMPGEQPRPYDPTTMTPEQYAAVEGRLGMKKAADQAAVGRQTAQRGPASEAAGAFQGRLRPQENASTPTPVLTHFEAALDGLRGQLEEGGAPGKIDPKAKGKPAGKGTHPIQAILAEFQLVRPDLNRKQLKELWAKDQDAVLREIAYARAQDAVASQKTAFDSPPPQEVGNTPGPGRVGATRQQGGTEPASPAYQAASGQATRYKLSRAEAKQQAQGSKEPIPQGTPVEAATSRGVGSEQGVPINRPLGPVDNARLPEMREAGKIVDEYHQRRNPQKRPRGPVLGSGLGGLQDFLEKRGKSGERERIGKMIDDIRKSGMTFNQTVDDIQKAKTMGEITGAQESALLREATKQYSEAILGPKGPDSYIPPSAIEEPHSIELEMSKQRLRQAQLTQGEFGPEIGGVPSIPVPKTAAEWAAFEQSVPDARLDIGKPGLAAPEGINFKYIGKLETKDGTKYYYEPDKPMPVTGEKGRQTTDSLKKNGIEPPDNPEQGFSWGGQKSKGPSGFDLGSGLGGAQKAFEKTWSNVAMLIEKLPEGVRPIMDAFGDSINRAREVETRMRKKYPGGRSEGSPQEKYPGIAEAEAQFYSDVKQQSANDYVALRSKNVIKAESLLNVLTKEAQRLGIPLTKAEIEVLEIPKFMELNKGRTVAKEELRLWIADRVVRTEEKVLADEMNSTEASANAKFNRDDLVLPGGSNYREVMIKAPEDWGRHKGKEKYAPTPQDLERLDQAQLAQANAYEAMDHIERYESEILDILHKYPNYTPESRRASVRDLRLGDIPDEMTDVDYQNLLDKQRRIGQIQDAVYAADAKVNKIVMELEEGPELTAAREARREAELARWQAKDKYSDAAGKVYNMMEDGNAKIPEGSTIEEAVDWHPSVAPLIEKLNEASRQFEEAKQKFTVLHKEYQQASRKGPVFHGGHFDPNTLAHMRLTDRTVDSGGRSHNTLFAEEFQSDWDKALRSKVSRGATELPSHPLVAEGNWRELLFKRLLRRAAEEGKNAIAWTTGKQQADRYNLRKHVERVHLEPPQSTAGTLANPAYTFTGITKDGQVLVSKKVQTFEQIQTLVGPDVAKKLFTGEAKEKLDMGIAVEVRGQELEIGGKWTTDLYDRQMVDIANKYAKRFGGTVEEGRVKTGSMGEAIPDGAGGLMRSGWDTSKLTVKDLRAAKDFLQREAIEKGDTSEGHARWRDVGILDTMLEQLDALPNEPIIQRHTPAVIESLFAKYGKTDLAMHLGLERLQKLEAVHVLPLTEPMVKSLLTEGNPTFGFLTKEGHAAALQNLRNIWKDMGRTLGSGPGGIPLEVFENLTKVGLYHLHQGLTNFPEWSRAMLEEGRNTGYPLTEEMLHTVWNSREAQGARPATDAIPTIAASIVNGNVQTAASLHSGAANAQVAQRLLAPEVGSGPTSMQAMTNADNVLRVVRDIWESDWGTKSGVSARVREHFPAVNESATHHVMSRVTAFLRTRTHVAELKTIFGQGGLVRARINGYLNQLSDLVLDDRARALEARGLEEVEAMRKVLKSQYDEAMSNGRLDDAHIIAQAIEDVGPPTHQVPKMDDATRARLLADPKIQAAIAYWKKNITPEIDLMTKELKIQAKLTGPLGLYVKMRQIDAYTANKFQRTRPLGTFPEVRDYNIATHTGTPGAQSPFDVRPGFSGSAKRASGKLREGRAYENDVRYMLEHTYADRTLAITKNGLRQAVRDAAITSKKINGLKPIPLKVKVGQSWEKVVGLVLEGPHGSIEDTYYVPESVKVAYDAAMAAPESGSLRSVWDAASSAMTAQVIILPAEAVRHGFNATAAVVNTRFMHGKGLPLEIGETLLAAATLGMSKMATALYRAYHLEGPALAEAIERYGSSGGLRLSGYEGTNVTRSAVMRAAEKVPGIHKLKELVFGDPGSSKGLRGSETRLRIVVAEVIKSMEPHLSDVEIAAKVNDAYGTYVNKLMPEVAKMLGPFDPFIRAGTGLTRSGIRLLEGKGVAGGIDVKIPGTNKTIVKNYSPLIHAQVAGTLAAIMLYNRLLDEEGKWPWERPEYKVGDVILLRRNGRVYRMAFTDMANSLKRGMEHTGVNAVANAVIRGERAPSVLGREWMRGVHNAITNRASPFIKAMATLTTGKSLSQSPSGDYYSTVKPRMSGAKGGIVPQLVKDIAKSSIPAAGKVGQLGAQLADPIRQKMDPTGQNTSWMAPSEDKLSPESYMGKVIYDIQDIFSVPYFPKIESASKSAKAGGEVQRRIQQEFNDTVRSIAREASNLPPEKRMTFILKEIDRGISNEIITELGNPMPAKPAALKNILSILLKAPAYNTKAEVLQNINLGSASPGPPPDPE